MSTKKAAVVPLNLELNYLENGKTVMNALADFSNQPWNDGERDHHADVPYLGETVLVDAFQNNTLYLEAGVHLFWTLPRGFRSAMKKQGESKQRFLAVPNRWLINKLDANGVPIKQWVVESDFLSNDQHKGINVAVPIELNKQPYKFMGQQLSLDDWRNQPTPRPGMYWPDYFKAPLTALGYGEPTFSTFYPNCRSVFASMENLPIGDPANYEVIGWYSDSKADILNASQTIQEQIDLLKSLNWELNLNNQDTPLDYSLYYGIIPIDKNKKIEVPNISTVSMAYSGAEAVSIYLAKSAFPTDDPEKVEETLEAILFGNKIANGSIDSYPNFLEARHQKEFDGQDGGLIWTIRNTSKTNLEPDAEINPDVADALNDLNIIQDEYDSGKRLLSSMDQQLYADWNKYIQACYPPLGEGYNFPSMDYIKEFTESSLNEKINPLKTKLGGLIVSNQNDEYSLSLSMGSSETSIAARVILAFNKLKQLLEADMPTWEINSVASPRFYVPKDPLVLFVGDAKDFEYLNEDVLQATSCFLRTDFDFASLVTQSPDIKTVSLYNLLEIPSDMPSFTSHNARWEPQLLQWRLDYYPVKKKSNEASYQNAFQRNFITANFELDVNQFDFNKNTHLISDGFQYQGSTYLAGSVKKRYLETLQNFIINQDPSITTQDFEAKIIQWKTDHPDSKNKAMLVAIDAWLFLKDKLLISQSLGGFNNALLQLRQNIHLPIIDPLGFPEYQDFTNRVAAELENKAVLAPLPSEQFMPIRVGGLRLDRLKFTDQFGEEFDLDLDQTKIIASDSFIIGDDTTVQWLPPRLSQSSRLNLRWISGKNDEVEVNSMFNTTPVCGWLVVNYLNSALVCYEDDGSQLGYFSISGTWYSALGRQVPFTSEDIVSSNPKNINVQLLSVLIFVNEHIAKSGGSGTENAFLKSYLDVLEKAQSNIYPSSNSGQDATSLMVSRPMALIRAKVGFEVFGDYQYDQSWGALISNMNVPYSRTTDNYESVKFPIRMGEQKQLEDGLVGFWLDGNSPEIIASDFYANVGGSDVEGSGILYSNLILKSLSEAPDTLTLLMDPRSVLHATTGILPVKTIQIPPEHYVQILRKIEVDFLTAPILSQQAGINISIPEEADKTWEWWEKDQNNIAAQKPLIPFDLNASLEKQEIKEGWLRLKSKIN